MATLIPIDDPCDPRIDAYRDIRERDLVGRQGLFVAEGKVVIEKMVGAGRHPLRSLLIAAPRVAGLAALLARVPASVPAFVAAQPVIDTIAGFPLHRGLLGIGERAAEPTADALLAAAGDRAPLTLLLLSGIANHDNMGGIFRNAAAFGVDGVLLDADCCDPLYRKAIRVSVGATLLVPHARLRHDEDPVTILDRHGVAAAALAPEGTRLLAGWRPPGRIAVLLGAEGPGLSPALLERVPSLRVAMSAGFDSLNVATTSGIVLYHLSLAPRSG